MANNKRPDTCDGKMCQACAPRSCPYEEAEKATRPHDLMKPTGVNSPMKKG